MQERLYELEHVSFKYRLGRQEVTALQDVSFRVAPSEMLLLMGPSGSGKSTTLNLLGLIEPMQEGQISFCGQSLAQLSERHKNHIRRFEIGFIFQSFLLFDVLTVAENIEYFLIKQGISKKERRERIASVLAAVGLTAKAHCRPTELSGGQRQRVAIARALAKSPKVIIADEPTANLDQHTAAEILGIMKELTTRGCTVIMSSHDRLTREYATRILNLCDGKLVGEGEKP